MDKQIIIVGGGPVGLALALSLAHQGIASLVLEKRRTPTPPHESRAIVWMPRGIEFLEAHGLLETFQRHSVQRTSHQFRRNGRKLLTLPFSMAASHFNYSLNLSQHLTEKLLEEACTRFGKLIEIRRGWEVIALDQDDEAVTVTAKEQDSVEEVTLKGRIAIGCDGAKSATRKLAGIALNFEDYGSHSAVADLECQIATEDPAVSWIDLDPNRPFGLFCFGEDRWRVIYCINKSEDPKLMTTEATVRQLVRRYFPQIGDYRLLWASSFRLGQGQSAAYYKGRIVLAGDAAHPMGPSAGAGMMVGIVGAQTLSNVLGEFYRDQGDASMVEYLERYQRAQRRVAIAMQRTNRMTFRQITTYPGLLAHLRQVILPLIDHISPLQRKIVRSDTLTDLR